VSDWWSDNSDFDVALTYFDIEIDDAIRSLDPATIVARCYNDQPNLASPFCASVFRDRPTANPTNNFISLVRAGFVNTGTESATGLDITTRLGASWGAADITWATATTWMDERLSQEFRPSEADADGSAIVNDVGRVGNPEWTFQSTLGVAWGGWDLVWQSRYFSDTQYPEGQANPVILNVDGLCEVWSGSGCPDGADPQEFFGDDGFADYGYIASISQIQESITDVGPIRAFTEADGQWQHDIGVTYSFEKSSITLGVNNLTDEEPPRIADGSGPNRNNAVSSARYDMIGRSWFLRYVTSF
jgi:iron complex outermembrane receptor protein